MIMAVVVEALEPNPIIMLVIILNATMFIWFTILFGLKVFAGEYVWKQVFFPILIAVLANGFIYLAYLFTGG